MVDTTHVHRSAPSVALRRAAQLLAAADELLSQFRPPMAPARSPVRDGILKVLAAQDETPTKALILSRRIGVNPCSVRAWLPRRARDGLVIRTPGRGYAITPAGRAAAAGSGGGPVAPVRRAGGRRGLTPRTGSGTGSLTTRRRTPGRAGGCDRVTGHRHGRGSSGILWIAPARGVATPRQPGADRGDVFPLSEGPRPPVRMGPHSMSNRHVRPVCDDPLYLPTLCDLPFATVSIAERWSTMRQLRGQFFRAWSEVQKRVEEATGGGKLPDEMARDWEARWAEQIFLGSIAQHPYLTPAEAACVVSQIRATFDAAWVVRGIEGAPSVWFHQSEHSRGPNDPAERVISWCWRNNRITDGERLRRSVETHNGGELSADVVLDQLNVWTRGVGSVHPARKTKLPTPNETPAWLRGLCFSLDPSWRAHFPVATACEKIRGPIQPSVTAVSEVLCIEGELLDSPGLDLTALRARLQRWLWRAEEAVRRQSNGQTGGTLTANAVESLRPDQLRFPDESVGQFGLKQILILRALMAAPNRALDRDSLARAAGYRQTEKGYHALQQRALAANGSFEKQDLLWLVETGEVYRLISTLKDNS